MPNPPRIPLEEMTLRQLRRVASDYEVSRYSRMRKVELIAAIQQKQTAAGAAPIPVSTITAVDGQTEIEASKFSTPAEPQAMQPTVEELATVDDGLGELPSGYGESRIVLLPRDPQWAYVYWDVPNEHKEQLRHQGGSRLALRFYDVTDVDLNYQSPHSLQQYECDEMAREWHLPIPVSDRDYIVEIGYVCNDGRWLILARSAPVRVPPVYPSDWMEDHFMTIDFNEELRGRTFMQLVPPSHRAAAAAAAAARGDSSNPLYDEIFAQTRSAEAMRVAGSLFGSMQQAQMPESAVSSYVFPSGAGLWALPTASGVNMSGAGFSASAPPMRPRKFWLIADAELIVYGATEPDATVTVGGKPIKLNADGTFRFQMSFQDGVIDYPIEAVAADGEQTRSIHMNFERETPSRHTNTKDEAVEEWFA
ncbi:DUF4912 domain-containing protein [Romeria aff. gracilis LEGE 07310]|uniref:DUF4912 domain-containing protein n=1 Tax=Vasconcelosia minhoensis LEGE 07310 TaxID=915328 RepID=A0A8J7AYT5_9CYAN|nr:DUF4912 domain-containing protein [Romeria gracilis]MBE9078822.1 DUF4912 domain-containing protein [Romeria aff. gracilis LEGE 07310]